jgi:hypothetical protein
MPMQFGAFETSLRGRDSPSVDRGKLHKGCCGSLHGHGVKKERSLRDIPAVDRHMCLETTSSSDESDLHLIGRKRESGAAAVMPVTARSQSSDCHLYAPAQQQQHVVAKRSSSAVVAQRLFSSPTMSTTAKLRAERTMSDGKKMTLEMKRLTERAGLLSASMSVSASSTSNLLSNGRKPRWTRLGECIDAIGDHDSGHFSSSDTESPLGGRMNFVRSMMTPTPEERKQNVILGVSDDEFSIVELRQRQRLERRDYVQGRSPKGAERGSESRRESPSPGPKETRFNLGDRGRRSSDELSSSTSPTVSPPTTPTPRSASSRPSSSEGFHFGSAAARRTASAKGNIKSYAFGSSVKRFPSTRKINLELPPPPGSSSSSASSKGYGSRHKSAPLHAKSYTHGVAAATSSDAEYHYRNPSLSRTSSDPSRNHLSGSSSSSKSGANTSKEKQRDVVAKAWLQFKDDIENAMLQKPNQAGLYKNLSDMMHTKMEMLNESEVGNEIKDGSWKI